MATTLVKGLGITVSLLCLGSVLHSRAKNNMAESGAVTTTLAGEASPLAEQHPGQAIDQTTEIAFEPEFFEQNWFVSASEAQQLIVQGATLLDARGKTLGQRQLAGAQSVSWDQFSPQTAHQRGRLLAEDDQLTQKLQALGISADRPVVVFGEPLNGWGEEGRIVWMLRTLGHRQAVMVDGGVAALRQIQLPAPPKQIEVGNFVVQRRSDWDIQRDALQRQLNRQLSKQLDSSELVVVDTRELREFQGQTPYGEQRGGHIPGAVHLYFKELLDSDGQLLAKEAIAEKLASLGITPDKQVVVYCTGGIRSGWLTAVLVSLGFSAQNYAGSMWEWSAGSAQDFPLETS